MNRLLSILVKVPYIGRFAEKKIIQLEGGQIKSNYLRNKCEKQYKVKVGLYTYGGCFSPSFNIGGEVEIGRYCSIAQDVHYFGANHPIESLSTSAIFYNKSFGYDVNDVQREKLVIGNDVWIGYGVLITSSCHYIGNGAIIGAGSVVTKDVEPFSIYAGVPAKKIKDRFSRDIRDLIEKTKWYDQKPETIMKCYSCFSQPEKFAIELSKENIIDLDT